MKTYSTLIILFITLLSCGYNPSENVSFEKNIDAPSNYSELDESEFKSKDEVGNTLKKSITNNGSISLKEIDRKIIWRGDVKFQVSDVNKSSNKIAKIVKEQGGIISNMNLTTTNYRISNTITIRIANENFHKLIQSVKGESIFVDHSNINSNDVTAEFVDIESRLKTKKEVRERYINILRNKTGNIKDVIAAEDAIRVITEEIEAKEGRLRYLKDKVNYSTIVIETYQKVDYKREPEINQEIPFSEKIGKSVGYGWSAIKGLLLFIVAIWPILLAGIITLLLIRRSRRKKK